MATKEYFITSVFLPWETLGLRLLNSLGDYPFALWSWSNQFCSILFFLSAVTLLINTGHMVPLAAIHVHNIPPPYLTDDVVCFSLRLSLSVISDLHPLYFHSWEHLLIVDLLRCFKVSPFCINISLEIIWRVLLNSLIELQHLESTPYGHQFSSLVWNGNYTKFNGF